MELERNRNGNFENINLFREQCVKRSSIRRRVKNWILTLGLNEEIKQLAMANNVHRYEHLLRRCALKKRWSVKLKVIKEETTKT